MDKVSIKLYIAEWAAHPLMNLMNSRQDDI